MAMAVTNSRATPGKYFRFLSLSSIEFSKHRVDVRFSSRD